MKVRLDVKDKSEAEALRRAWDDPETRAFILIVGTLLPFSQRARERIMHFIGDYVDEQGETQPVRLSVTATSDEERRPA